MFDVITIGTATRDVFLLSKHFKTIKDAHFAERAGFPTGEAECFALGSKVGVDQAVFTTGGGATNAAVTFARQGMRTAVLAKIGGDEAGSAIRREMLGEGVRPFLIQSKRLNTAYSTILLSASGERTILVYRGASDNLKTADVRLPATRWAYINPGGIDYAVTKQIVERLVKKGVLIAMNPSRAYLNLGAAKLKSIFRKIRVVILNREEAAGLTRADYGNEREIFRRLDEMVPGLTVMTEGAKGVMVSDGSRIYRAGIFKEKRIADRTGAGDAFGSGFVAGLFLRGEACEQARCGPENVGYAIRLASANATSVVEEIGAKKGILTKGAFKGNKRWSELNISRLS